LASVREPTLTLIARRCAVSKMTVSRALRNEASVRPATRDFILRVAEKVGFQPSGRYHRMKGRTPIRSYCVLFQSEYSSKDEFFSGIIVSVQQELFARDYSCSFGLIKNDYADFLKLNRMLRSRDVQGILIVGEIPPRYASVLQTNFLNLVFIDYPGDPEVANPYNAVCVDNVYGGHLALNHLLGIGRKRILLICGKEGHYFSNDLLRAYRETLAEHQIEIDPRLVVYADFHKEGFKATEQVLKAGVQFDAIFSNDEMACGAIKALKQAGRKVPEDVSVVGFDGLPVGEMVSPTLTTVAVDRQKMGRLAVKRLLHFERETGEDEKFEKISIFPRLIVRESCGGRPEKATE